MKTEMATSLIANERIEQLSTLALIVGVLAVFQWQWQWLFSIGLILLAVGTLGTLASQVINKNNLPRILERLSVIGMMVGILGMLQAWHIWLYENGFYLVALSTIGFIVVSHIDSPNE